MCEGETGEGGRDGRPCSSAWRGGIRSANSMSSSALNTSEAEMLLCCLEVETSCALRKASSHGSVFDDSTTYVAAVCVALAKGSHRTRARVRTEVIDKHCRAFDERENRILLQLHVFRNLPNAPPCHGREDYGLYSVRRTADFAIRVTRARGSSKFSMPSETASCWACAEAGALAFSLRGIMGVGMAW